MGRTIQKICTATNIPDSLKLLNTELHFLDIPHVAVNENDPKSSLAQLINVCYELAAVIKRNTKKINEQFEELLQGKSTLNIVHQEKDRLKTQLTNETNKVEDFKAKFNYSESRITTLNSQIRNMKREVAQLQHTLSTQKLLHEHEIRRKDSTISSLKSKIYQNFRNESSIKQDKTKAHKNAILSSHYDEILDKYVCQLHNNIHVLLEENAQYRDLLESLYNRVSVDIIDCPGSTIVKLSELPCHLVLKTVENNFNLFAKKFIDTDDD